jgi:hypothetical protein
MRAVPAAAAAIERAQGGRFVARGATKSMTFRLATNETITTASAIETVFRCIGRRIVPPDPSESPHNVLQRRR